jgi:GAF domain-containing protein
MARKNQTSGTVTGKIDRGKTTDALIEKRKSKQVKIREDARIKSAGQNGDLKRQLKIQKALYEIADAASAVKDMGAFYKNLHKIIGKLMYAENFFIALYDKSNDLITWPYLVDTVDLETPPPTRLSDQAGATGWVIRHGKTVASVDGSWGKAISSGEAQYVGTESNGIAVPLRVDNKTIGVVMVQSYLPEIGYQLDDVKMLGFVAQHISTALTRARAIDETRQRNTELEIVNSIQQGLAAELDFQAIVDLVGDKLREVFNTPDLSITWYDEKANLIHYLYLYEHGKRLDVSPDSPKPGGIYDTELKTRRPVVLNNAADFAKITVYLVAGTDQAKSAISVPIISSDRFLGNISIENHERENAFGESEIRLLTTIAASLGTALENARLFDEVQKKNAEISEALERESVSNDILRVIAESPTDIQPVLEVIARNAAQLSGSEDAIIGLVEGGILLVSAHHGDIPTFPVGGGIRFNRDSVAGRAMIDGLSLQAIHNQHGVKPEYPEGDKVAKKYDYKMTCAVPLLREGKAVGVISIRRTRPELLTEKQISLIQSFANQAAIAVSNVRLFEAEQQRVAELQIINSVQEGLAKQLDFQGIIDLIGDKVGEIFKADTTAVGMVDIERDRLLNVYYVDRGVRIPIPDGPVQRPSLTAIAVDTRKPLLIDTQEEMIKLGAVQTPSPGEKVDKNESFLGAPILTGDRLIGVVAVQSYEQYAYNQDDMRLLQPLANSMSIALENARLFDETQRLLKETEERNAELAVINSVQAGLVAQMDIQGIYNLVGDKIRGIFDVESVVIFTYDRNAQIFQVRYGMEETRTYDLSKMKDKRFFQYFDETKQTLLINENFTDEAAKYGIYDLGDPATLYDMADARNLNTIQYEGSALFVPLLVGSEVKGFFSLQDSTRENAFSEAMCACWKPSPIR